MMYVQYLNKDPHTIIDGKNHYDFRYNQIRELPDNVGRFVVSRFPFAFKKVDRFENIVNDKKSPSFNAVMWNDTDIIFHIKKKNERSFKSTLSPAVA